jgi:hypothetical protein
MDIFFIVLLILPSVLGAEKLFTFDSDLSRNIPECDTANYLACKRVIPKLDTK